MARRLSGWAVVFLLGACHAKASQPAAPTATTAQADAGAASALAPPLSAFDDYYGFSSDGLVFAYAVRTPSGLRLRWLSSTTNTVEKSSALETPEQRSEALSDLKEDGFPAPGTPVKPPPHTSAEIRKGRVVVLFSGMPAGHPFKPFVDMLSVTPVSASVVAASPDGKLVAVKVTGKVGEVGTVPPDFQVVPLFE